MKKQLSAKKIRENEQSIASAKKEFAKKFGELFSYTMKFKTSGYQYQMKQSTADRQESQLSTILGRLESKNLSLRDVVGLAPAWLAQLFTVTDGLECHQWIVPEVEDPCPYDEYDYLWLETEETRQAARIRSLFAKAVEIAARMAFEIKSDTYAEWRQLYLFVADYAPPLVRHVSKREIDDIFKCIRPFNGLYKKLWADLRLSGKDGGRCRETGSWARRFVSDFDAKHGYVELKCGNQRSFRIPEKSAKAWAILTSLFRSEDPDGWTKLPTNWKSHFMRKIGSSGTVDAENDLVKIAAFIRPHTPGKGRSGDGKYRFAPILISAEKLK